MKKHISLIIMILLTGALFIKSLETKVVTNPSPLRKVYPQHSRSILLIHDRKSVDATRSPAVDIKEAKPRVKTLIQHKKERSGHPFQAVQDPSIKLPYGLIMAEQVYAIAKDDFSSSQGEKVFENAQLIFFKSEMRPQGNPGVANVALDEANHKYYPINAIVKLENITEETRQELKARGLEENYYQESLQIMYIQSSHDEVIKLYTDLTSLNLTASLEVTRSFHKPR